MRVTVRKEGWLAAVFEHGRAPVYHNGVLGRQVAAVVGRRVVQLFARPGVADRARRFDQRPHPATQNAVVDRIAAIVERGRQVCASVDVQAHAHP